MKKIKNAISDGFTLVELLIVIGLLGAIALIVISAINPIEQSNRARDTRFKADGGQLISAVDRYFTARSEFPWMTTSVSGTYTTDSAFGFMTSSHEDVGVCGATCTVDGTLLSTSELKTEFLNRDFIKKGATGTVDQKILIGKAIGSSSSIYACFIPLAKSTREKACSDGKVYTLNLTTGARTAIVADDPSCAAASTTWTTGPQYVCIPE